jgi:hypothetical protein
LDDSFRGLGTRCLCTTAIPGPDRLERRRIRDQVESGGPGGHTGAKGCFQSALDFAREQAKVDSLLGAELAAALAKHCVTQMWDHIRSSIMAPKAPIVLSEKYLANI